MPFADSLHALTPCLPAMPLHIRTPYLRSSPLSRHQDVWLKLEALQPCGSFKLRGVGALCEARLAQGARGFISSSGGNAGIAAAYAGRALGVPVRVVVPETTSARARQIILDTGAQLTVHGRHWAEAHARAEELTGPQDAFVHPFDDPLLWQGHASLVDEMAEQGPQPDVVLLSVGGGGLLCGVLEGLWRNGWSDVSVLAVETAGADSFAASLKAGHPVALPQITSIATTLGAKQPCDEAVRRAQRHPVQSLVVSDAQAVAAAVRLMDDHRLVVEPACGAALAALAEGHPLLDAARSIAVVVCGGVTTPDTELRALHARLSAAG